MQISVSVAKARLPKLVDRIRSGDEVILTRDGQAVARLVPIKPDILTFRAAAELHRAAGRTTRYLDVAMKLWKDTPIDKITAHELRRQAVALPVW